MIRRRQGAVLVMSVFFLLLSVTVVGFLIDVTRIQLAKQQLRALADSAALATVNNFQIATYTFDHVSGFRQVHFIMQSPQDCWIPHPYQPGMYIPNSLFFNRNGEPFQDSPDRNEPCVTVRQIAEIYTQLNLSTLPFEKAGFPQGTGYQFDPNSVQVTNVVAINENESPDGEPAIIVELEGRVDLIFGNILGMDSVTIREQSQTTLQFLSGGN